MNDSREAAKELDAEELSAVVVDVAFHIHKDLGPGLLESVYEAVLAGALERRGLRVERQKVVSFEFDGVAFDEGLRVDLMVTEIGGQYEINEARGGYNDEEDYSSGHRPVVHTGENPVGGRYLGYDSRKG